MYTVFFSLNNFTTLVKSKGQIINYSAWHTVIFISLYTVDWTEYMGAKSVVDNS